MDEIKADLDHGIADCVAADLALLEHLLARHAAFDAYCQQKGEVVKTSAFDGH